MKIYMYFCRSWGTWRTLLIRGEEKKPETNVSEKTEIQLLCSINFSRLTILEVIKVNVRYEYIA
jgi:hypothetical protein